MRVRLLLPYAFCMLFTLHGAGVFGQASRDGTSTSDEEKRKQFLRAREEMRTLPPTTPVTATPAPKPKPKPRATPKSAPATPRETPSATPRPVKPDPTPSKPTPEPSPRRREPETPDPRPRPPARSIEREPSPRPVTPPPATPPPVTPPPRPQVRQLPRAPITIEKSGVEEERGLQPAAPRGWFTRWKYLPRSIRQEIDRAPVQKRRWRYIVIHNSGTRQGNAKAFEYYHLRVRKMPNGLAYHFVIGNGTSSGDGEIEVGNRWRRQINGGHVHSDYLNNIALGICLVGDYNRDNVTARQLAAMDELIRYLRQRVGKIDRKWAIVKAHRAINPPRWPTDCPGDKFPYGWIETKFK